MRVCSCTLSGSMHCRYCSNNSNSTTDYFNTHISQRNSKEPLYDYMSKIPYTLNK